MRFSVIIPVYNGEKYIARCIDCLLEQGFQDYELILIDDGSTDDSLKILREYQAAHPKIVLTHQNNAGPSAARNSGLALAQGEYILFVDIDDVVTSDYFQRISDEIEKNRCDIVIFGMRSSENKTTPSEGIVVEGNRVILDYYGKTWSTIDYNSCCNKAFCRRFLISNGISFMENTTVEEDLVFNMLTLDCAERLSQITDILYIYDQKEEGSLTTSYNPKRFEGKLVSYQEEMRLLKKWELEEVINFQECQLVNFVSVSINNLLYKKCALSYKEKLNEIKKYFNNEFVIASANNLTTKSVRTKIMRFLIKRKLYRTGLMIHHLARSAKSAWKKSKPTR